MLIFYVVFFFLIIRFTVTLFNFISNPKLTNSPKHYTDFVSILIPARNEAENIPLLLKSILEQDYQDFEVLILDDDSTDETFAVCEAFAESDKRFRVIKGNTLAEGWLGKNYACYQLAQQAKGKYLMFLDADENIKKGLINNALHRMKMGRLALLSLFTNQEMHTLGEKLVVPLMHFLLLNLLPLRLVKLSKKSSLAAASGQFMLFDAAIYHANQWHTKVKDKIVEDVEIIKRIKTQGYTTESLLANGYIFCRMYRGYKDAINGFSKNLLAGFNNNIAALICYLLLVMLGPVFVAIYLDIQLLFFALTLIILTRIMISLASGQNALINIVLHPFQMLSFIIIAGLSIKKSLSSRISWKGRTIKT
jgi:glycosyltransferase involved in cell wall biosynthesis